MTIALRIGVLALAAGASVNASAQTIANPVTSNGDGRASVGGAFAMSTVEYDIVDEEEFDRKILAAELGYGLTSHFDLFAQLGYVMDASIDVDGSDPEGDGGFVFGVGGRFLAHESRPLRVYAYGLLNMIKEDYELDGSDVKLEVSLTELHLGVLAAYQTGGRVTPYGGLELVPMSDGKIKAKGRGASSSEDMERDDVLVMRLGAAFNLTNVTLRADAALIGETTITLGASTTL